MVPARTLAAPAARLSAAAALLVLAVSLLAGVVRVLPLVLAPGVPLAVVPVLARGVLGVSLETALFVAAPIGWALAAARLVERGEARALFALGVSPLRLVRSSWPAALGIAAMGALAALSWGKEAVAPGRILRDLLAEARSACEAGSRPAAADVPLLGLSWICLPGEPPRVLGPARALAVADRSAGAIAVFAAQTVEISDDLRSLEATGLTLLVPASGDAPAIRIQADRAAIRGIPPLGRASNLSVAARALLLATSSALLAAASAVRVLAGAIRSRAAALALGASGPGAALLIFSALERSPASPRLYAAVPAVGLAVVIASVLVARLLRGRALRRARMP